jgi:flagellar protein FlaG
MEVFMGIQILSLGNNIIPQDTKAHLTGEQKAEEQAEFTVPGGPGSGNTKASDLQRTAADLEQVSIAFSRRLKFLIDQESGEILIKVIDNETDKVIKVLPPEELQRLHSRIRETIGFLIDRMV